jgi:hypothetical protein
MVVGSNGTGTREFLSHRSPGGISMHQQVRTSIRRTRSDDTSGRLEEGSLVEILDLLTGTNLRSAGRVRLESGDEQFVFSVQHVGNEDAPDQAACDVLTGANYEAAVFKVQHYVLPHRPGALFNRIKRLETTKSEPVIEVHVGAAEPDGKVPVQLVTRSMLNR